jgi:hypothetical protein
LSNFIYLQLWIRRCAIEKRERDILLFLSDPNGLEGFDKNDNVHLISGTNGDFSPTRLNFEVIREITKFTKEKKEEGVIFLTNLEDLITNRDVGFYKVYTFITKAKEAALKYGSELIIQFNPKVFEADEGLSAAPHYFERMFHITKQVDISLSDLVIKYGEQEGYQEAARMIKSRIPILMHIDDLSSLDPKSFDFIRHVLKRGDIVGNGVSIIASTVGDEYDDLFKEKIILNNFSMDEAKELINQYSHLWKIKLTEGDVQQIYSITQGNPLNIIEILKEIKESGTFKPPEDIKEIVKNKLDKLTNGEQEHLLYYSLVLGKFDAKMLAYMSNPDINENIFDKEYSLAMERASLFIKRLKELDLLEKSEEGYALSPTLVNLLSEKTPDELWRVLHARASLVLSEKYSSTEYHLRSLYHLSQIKGDVTAISKMLHLSRKILSSADENTRYSVLEALVNSLDESNHLEINTEDKPYAIEAYMNLAELYLSSNVNKAVDVLSRGETFARNQGVDDSKIAFSFARAFHIERDIDSAEEIYKQLVYAPKRDIRFNSNLGLARIYLEKGDFESYETHLNIAMREDMNPTFKSAIKGYLNALQIILDNPMEAKNLLRANLNKLGGRFKDYYLLDIGVAYALNKNPDLSRYYFKKTVHSRYPEVKMYALFNLGILEGDDDYFKDAMKIAEENGLKIPSVTTRYALIY